MEKPILVGNETDGGFDGEYWDGGVLGNNGNIYGIPFNASQVLRFNPTNKQTSTVGKAFEGNCKWSGGVVTSKGVIYGIPFASRKFLRFDPSTETATLIGVEYEGDLKWSGGVVAKDGLICCAPYNASRILKLNPSNDTTSLVGNDLGEGGSKWIGGVAANNGCVYFIPYNAKQVLKFDPSDESTVLIGNEFDGGHNWWDAVLADDGYIYAIPSRASQILKIDPTNDSTVLLDQHLGDELGKWSGGVLGQDRNIYGIPDSSKYVLKFDPRSQRAMTIPLSAHESSGWSRGVVEANGVIYGIPFHAKQMLMFEPLRFDPSRNAQDGINDSPHDGPDRLGYQLYADALVKTALMVEAPNSSLCVGLYAPWGSGKTFLWRLIMKSLKVMEEAAMVEAGEDPITEAPESKRFILIDELCFLLMKATTNNAINESLLYLPHILDESEQTRQQRNEVYEIVAVKFALLFPFLIIFSPLLLLPESWKRRIGTWIVERRIGKWIVLYYEEDLERMEEDLERMEEDLERHERIVEPHEVERHERIVERQERHERIVERHGLEEIDLERHGLEEKDLKRHGTCVRNVLIGETCVGEDQQWKSSISRVCRSLFLTGVQTLSRAILSCQKCLQSTRGIITTCVGNTVCLKCCSIQGKTVRDGLTKHIFVEFNAWVYSGSDLLWASLIEELWKAVENVVGKKAVRIHRASVELSQEAPDDDVREKRKQRKQALYNYNLNWYISTIVSIVGTVAVVVISTFPSVQNSISDVTTILTGLATEIVALVPFGRQIYAFIKKVWPELRKSRGERILEEAESYQRKDFSEKTGFMGEVRQEVHYLFEFLKTYRTEDGESLRLVLFVDDLDRCPRDIVVRVLQAVILLLADAPVTCWLAIDSRIVVTSIEEYFGEVFAEAGISGHEFLDKIVQLPFCIPDMSDDKKSEYCERLGLNQVLTVEGMYERLKPYFPDHVKPLPLAATREAMLSSIFEYLEDESTLSSMINSEPSFSMTFDQVKQLVEKARMDDHYLDDLLYVLYVRWRAIVAMTADNSTSNNDDRNAYDSTDARASNVSPEPPATPTQSADALGIIPSNQTTTDVPADVTDLGQNQNLVGGALSPTQSADALGIISSNQTTTDVPADVTDLGQDQNLCEPMLNDKERQWLIENSRFVSGKPRTIKRILNVFNVARCIATHYWHTDTEFSETEFPKKLLKFVILLEQWPYRMAWLIQIAEDVIQEHAIEKNGTVRCPGKTLAHLCSLLLHDGPRDLQRMYKELDLSKVFTGIVQSLMHALSGAEMLLRRDGDAQLFEMFLNSDPQLTLGDLESPHADGKSVMNLRNYTFNLPRSMLERVSTYANTHTFGPKYNEEDEEQTNFPPERWYPVFSKKSSIYDQVHD